MARTAVVADRRGDRLGLAAARIEMQRDSRADVSEGLGGSRPDAGAAAGDENALFSKVVEHERSDGRSVRRSIARIGR